MVKAPSVGIFWFVADAAGGTRLLALGRALADAEPYGDCLTLPDGHAHAWGAWRDGSLPPPAPGLHPVIDATEYDEWPRGRVVFDTNDRRFVVYADRQLLTAPRLARVRAAFALPADGTVARGDPHYSRSARLPPDAESG